MTTQEFHNLAISIAHDMFINRGSVPAMMFAVLPDNTLISCAKQFDGNDEKQDTFNMYAIILKMTKAIRYSFFSEMWFAQEVKGPFRLPSQRSDRKEGVFISTHDTDEEQFFASFEIKRPENQLVDAGMSGDHYVDSVNLFKRLGPTKLSGLEFEAVARGFNAVDKPEWYTEWDFEDFLRTQ